MKDIQQIVADAVAAGTPLTAAQAEQFIVDVPPRTESTIFRGDAGFRRSRAFLHLAGDPQDARPAVHIAGTSGKGSVVATLTALLGAHDKDTGSYSSPHVYDLRERWRHNGELVSGSDLAAAVAQLYPAIQQLEATEWGRPTYFEVTTALAFLLCQAWQVDYAIIETGMGGLYDTTNAITRPDKLAVISELGLDHTHILGNTLGEIAGQKAGILPPDGDAIVLEPTDATAAQVIADVARERRTRVNYISPESYQNVRISADGTVFDYHGTDLTLLGLELGLAGAHQAKNASLALAALEFLAARDGFTIDEQAVRTALKTVSLPGRFERREIYGHAAIFDGAHNPQKLGALADTLAAIYPGQRFTWLMAFGKTKDALASLQRIAPLVQKLAVTKFFGNQDLALSSKATDPAELAELARRAGIKDVVIEADSRAALKTAAAIAGNAPLIVAGSFYLLGELKED
jgi:dihydrofolate synthase/folylpolyglutamate synthase